MADIENQVVDYYEEIDNQALEAILKGKDGITPTIGANGNWYIGDTDTGKPSRGLEAYEAGSGISIQNGVISNTRTSVNWGHINGTIGSQSDLMFEFNKKADHSEVPQYLAQLRDDSGHRTVTDSDKSYWNGKYNKPSTGIPKVDLASDVQTSLGKADTALQQHQDISGKLDTSKVKSSYSTTSGDVYDVTYINSTVGDIETLLGGI